MSNKKENATATVEATDAGEVEQEVKPDALARVDTTNLLDAQTVQQLSAGEEAAIIAELQDAFKSLTITKLTAARDLMGQNLTVVDAFIHTFNFGDDDKSGGQRVVEEIFDAENNHHFVAQSINRSNIVDIFSRAKLLGKKLTMTNMQFVETGKKTSGNFPIVLTLTKESQALWS